MKIHQIFLLGLLLVLTSCKDKNIVSQDAIDKQKILDYLEQNQLEAESLPSGLFYIINESGNDNHPTIASSITVSYTGRLLNGSKFDEGEFFTGELVNLIKGWQEGIPLIGEGGRINLIIPSSLGYGGQSAGSIPPNSVLRFEVKLHYFSNPD